MRLILCLLAASVSALAQGVDCTIAFGGITITGTCSGMGIGVPGPTGPAGPQGPAGQPGAQGPPGEVTLIDPATLEQKRLLDPALDDAIDGTGESGLHTVYRNDTAAGTTQHKLVCLQDDSGREAVNCGAALDKIVGVANEGAGVAGKVRVCAFGLCAVLSDNACTLGDWAVPAGVDSSARCQASKPTDRQLLGLVIETTAGPGPVYVAWNSSFAPAGTATGVSLIASGTTALGTSSISPGACASLVTASASGVFSTDRISWNPNANIDAVAGYQPSTAGGLSIVAYPSAGSVHFSVCNWSASPQTPGPVVLNWGVVR